MSTKRAIYDVAEFKAFIDEEGKELGKFEALVSVFGNVDLQGDRVVEGAFKDSLAEWQSKGAPIPIIWSHAWGDPNAHIGSANPSDVTEVKGRGLKVAGTIDLDNPFAAQVYRLLKERRVREFSFGYEVVREKMGKDGANELLELRIIEAGPTLKGANPNTELLAVKSDLERAASEESESVSWSIQIMTADGKTHPLLLTAPPVVRDEMPDPTIPTIYAVSGKAGRSISSKNETRIRGAMEALQEVLASLGDADEKTPTTDTDEAKAQPADEPKAIDRELLELQALLMTVKG